MPSNIKKFDWVATPKNATELAEYAESLCPSEKSVFMLATVMTWNMMVDMIEETYHADDK